MVIKAEEGMGVVYLTAKYRSSIHITKSELNNISLPSKHFYSNYTNISIYNFVVYQRICDRLDKAQVKIFTYIPD